MKRILKDLLIILLLGASSGVLGQNPMVIDDSLVVNQRVYAKDKLIVDLEAKFKQDIKVLGTARVEGDLIVQADLKINGTSKLNGDVKMENIGGTSWFDGLEVLVKLPNGQIKKSTLKDLIVSASLPPATIDYCLANGGIGQWWAGPKKLYTACPDVNVGIATNDPLHKLHVNSGNIFGLKILTGNALATTGSLLNGYAINNTDGLINVGVKIGSLPEESRFSVTNSGSIKANNVGAGPTLVINNGTGHAIVVYASDNSKIFQLQNDGLLRSREIRVDAATWADFVFDENYVLPKLKEVGAFIQANHHLPGIPSSEDIQNNGLNVSEMQAAQMQKIEELTLYLIEMDHKMDQMQAEIDALKKENEGLKANK